MCTYTRKLAPRRRLSVIAFESERGARANREKVRRRLKQLASNRLMSEPGVSGALIEISRKRGGQDGAPPVVRARTRLGVVCSVAVRGGVLTGHLVCFAVSGPAASAANRDGGVCTHFSEIEMKSSSAAILSL